ncbi:MAG: CPBP family intramembrane metalloprotease [Burkholderiales bacterium]|nr:CPBP family intramembrane metalloprotease [Burkholderiales bacterium]
MQESPQSVRKTKLLYALLSPVFLVAACALVQVLAGQFIGVWAWVPTMLFFWIAIAFLTYKFSGSAGAFARFNSGSGNLIWPALALLAGLLSLHGFIGHWTLLSNLNLVVAWLVFALFNPWFEESYWRGVLLDATASWGKLPSLLYSSIWFAASHPLIWGIHSLPLRKMEAAGALLFVGLIWGRTYQRTGSLRWCVAGHMLANLFGLAALVLLNLYDPTVR